MIEGDSGRTPGYDRDQGAFDAPEVGFWSQLAADVGTATLAFVCWRGVLFLFQMLGVSMTQLNPVAQMDPAYAWKAFPNHEALDSWVRWDAGWYQLIVTKGYAAKAGQSSVAFFPGFPLVTSALTKVIGNHWAAGLIVSNVSLLAALVYMLRIARPMLGDDGSRRMMAYMLAFPTSFFLSAYYSEGLFLLTTLASFHHYLSGRYARSAIWGALATLTRPTGMALLMAYGLGTIWNLARGQVKFTPRMLWLSFIPAGLLTFMAMLYVKVGDPLAFIHAHGAWGRSSSLPFVPLIRALLDGDWTFPRNLVNTITLMEAITGVIFLILPFFLLGKADISLPIYSWLLILIPLATANVKSLMRLECVAFPAFLVLARWGESRRVDRLIIFASALFLGFFTMQFANWYWVG
ncbi:mannosyltransferase family protein [Isosphaeraceae bacterium EP7]